ncbi:flagellar brake protein [Janthinobacterium sp. 17J80-10]|uniref:flagellar brake protein n=1 Tax=Janthinobacterium sp. 17J80-10 TaxID=2497863 RepID=UPI0010055916|nr:flagellar brake protein [Janthinobacterium sp. 17J80-10]QAU33222.1 flagellar brake protein [Janthinobacterium sp. 17J80-10]
MTSGVNFDGIDERFFVHGRMEILALLNEFIYRHEPFHVHFGVAERIVTHLLEARDQALVFEVAEVAAANQRLASASSCTFLACPDGIRVQFAAGPAQPVSWGGSAAFSVPLPSRLARLQRQESFRVVLPHAQAPQVSLHASDGTLLGAWPLHDLSAGGISVALNSQVELGLAPQVARVHLVLDGHGIIDSAVNLRHATALTQGRGGMAFRIGLGFSGMPDAMRVAIQRYIIDVEHARRNAHVSFGTEG